MKMSLLTFILKKWKMKIKFILVTGNKLICVDSSSNVQTEGNIRPLSLSVLSVRTWGCPFTALRTRTRTTHAHLHTYTRARTHNHFYDGTLSELCEFQSTTNQNPNPSNSSHGIPRSFTCQRYEQFVILNSLSKLLTTIDGKSL